MTFPLRIFYFEITHRHHDSRGTAPLAIKVFWPAFRDGIWLTIPDGGLAG